MNEYSDMNFILGAIGFICVLFAISKIGSTTNKPDKPKAPEPLSNPNRAFTDNMPDASFDATAFSTARNIIGSLERMPDTQSKTMLLADALHRLEVSRQRTADRMTQQQQKEADTLDKALALAERLSGIRGQVTPPPPPQYNPGRGYYQEPQRINNWENRQRLPEYDDMQVRPGYWERY